MLNRSFRAIWEVWKMSEKRADWKVLLSAASIPFLLITLVNILIGNPFSEESFKRFANAILTAYIITGILLMVNMFAYAGSRERPYAPIMGMIIAIMAGIGIGFLLLYNNDIIMEDNGSFQAQALYNIVHIIASGFAMILAVLLTIGSLFATITATPTRFPEEE